MRQRLEKVDQRGEREGRGEKERRKEKRTFFLVLLGLGVVGS